MKYPEKVILDGKGIKNKDFENHLSKMTNDEKRDTLELYIGNNKFTGKRCTKCRSKYNNEKLKEKQYYKKYYDENKELLLENVAKYYIEI